MKLETAKGYEGPLTFAPRWSSSISILAFAGAVIAAGLKLSSTMLNLDVGGLLLNARAFELGRTLYDSYFQMNTPSNTWLPVLSVKIAHLVPYRLADVHMTVQFLLVLACVIATLLLMWSVLRARRPITLIAASFILPMAFLSYPGYDFGQREPLFLSMLAPFAVVLLARHHGHRVSAAAAIGAAALAAFGASMKPHFMLLVGAIILAEFCLNRGRLRQLGVEIFAVVGLLLLYVVGIAIVYPTYFTEVLPDAAASYGTMGQPLSVLLTKLRWERATAVTVFALVLVRAVVFWRRPSGARRNTFLVLWLVLAVLSLAIYFSQSQGFRYHSLMLVQLLIVSTGLCVAWLADDLELPRRVPALALALSATAIVCSWQVGMKLHTYLPSYTRETALNDPLTQMLTGLPPNTAILMLVTSDAPISPLHAYADIVWTGEYSTLALLRSIHSARDRAIAEGRPLDPKASKIERDFRSFVLNSFSPPPEVVFVAVSQPLRWFEDYPRPVSIIDFLSEQPDFAAEWKNYERRGTIRSIYETDLEVYVRVTP